MRVAVFDSSIVTFSPKTVSKACMHLSIQSFTMLGWTNSLQRAYSSAVRFGDLLVLVKLVLSYERHLMRVRGPLQLYSDFPLGGTRRKRSIPPISPSMSFQKLN